MEPYLKKLAGFTLIKRKLGFTLLELLIVIAILGVLSILGFGTYTKTQKRSRDARRRADLKEIQSAQEQYYAINGVYTNIAGTPCTGAITDILNSLPQDPKGGTTYQYACLVNSTTTPTSYCARALMEIIGSGNCSGCTCPADGCVMQTANTNYFCVLSQQ